MQIEHDKLTARKTVWYSYSKSDGAATGPYVVKRVFSDHEGQKVHLQSKENKDDERIVLLADDDLYGQPIFYTKQPT